MKKCECTLSLEALQENSPLLCTFSLMGQTDSTNKEAMIAAGNGAPHGYTVIAETQTAGHGRYDRSFFSPAGTGLYMSVVLRPDAFPLNISMLTVAAATAVALAAEEVGGKDTAIKWVNDVLCEGRKAAGILTACHFDTDGKPDYAVLGIGCNIYEPKEGFPPEIAGIAGSFCGDGVLLARERLAGSILSRLFDYLNGTPFMDVYAAKSIVLKQTVTVYPGGFEKNEESGRKAKVLGLEENGNLRVRFADGVEEVLSSGEVSLSFS